MNIYKKIFIGLLYVLLGGGGYTITPRTHCKSMMYGCFLISSIKSPFLMVIFRILGDFIRLGFWILIFLGSFLKAQNYFSL